METEPWYREELQALREMVIGEIQSGKWSHDAKARIGLGGLLAKLDRKIAEAIGMMHA